jgi:NAD(P)-dependent dehydrogenase (short-subunit alcohol dehydrogenase family)
MRTALITGAASGIGEATARLFGERGWHVIAVDRNETGAQSVAAAIRAAGGSAEAIALDIASETDVERVVVDVLARHGAIDACVNSAGILENAVRLTRMPMREWDDIMNVNLRGAALLARAVGAAMCSRGQGSIVHLCSMTSVRPSAQPAYAVSKAGLKMLTEVMAAEFGPSGVRVNAVAPGYTLTPALKQRIEAGERNPARVLDRSALKRFVEPTDVAEAIAFLCSPAASAITGVMLPVDCGWIAYSSYSAYAATPQD